jgi:nucleoside-triphosphatase THEP1
LKFIIYLYSLETPLYAALNKARREMDVKQIDTLGPFDFIFTAILSAVDYQKQAPQATQDWLTVYRGAMLTESQLESYK